MFLDLDTEPVFSMRVLPNSVNISRTVKLLTFASLLALDQGITSLTSLCARPVVGI